MSAKVASELKRARVRLNPRRHGGPIKPKPLIFEPDHRNIATLIAFLMTIFLGLGAGWLAGGALSGSSNPSPVEEARAVTQTEQIDSPNTTDEADAVKQAESQPPVVEEQSDKDESRTRVRRRAGSRRVYAAGRAGESVPLSVIKGKPLKKAFRQFKRVRIW